MQLQTYFISQKLNSQLLFNFRVAFIGRGFPAFLQNMTFVYRGKGFERLADFESRILDQFPHAEPMRTMDAPTDEEKEDAKQRVQIIKVNFINTFTSKAVSK